METNDKTGEAFLDCVSLTDQNAFVLNISKFYTLAPDSGSWNSGM